MTLAEQDIGPWYKKATEMFGVLPPVPIYGADYAEGPNAYAGLFNFIPYFHWRTGYPSPAMDPSTATARPRGPRAMRLGVNTEEQLEGMNGRQPGEFFGDAFGAALSGEWITPIGSSAAGRYRYELPTVTPQEARDFSLAVVGRNAVDYPGAVWCRSPNSGPAGRSASPSSSTTGPPRVSPADLHPPLPEPEGLRKPRRLTRSTALLASFTCSRSRVYRNRRRPGRHALARTPAAYVYVAVVGVSHEAMAGQC